MKNKKSRARGITFTVYVDGVGDSITGEVLASIFHRLLVMLGLSGAVCWEYDKKGGQNVKKS